MTDTLLPGYSFSGIELLICRYPMILKPLNRIG